MTFTQIIAALEVLTEKLANDLEEPPLDLSDHEWAYVKGLASGEILRLRDRLITTAMPTREQP